MWSNLFESPSHDANMVSQTMRTRSNTFVFGHHTHKPRGPKRVVVVVGIAIIIVATTRAVARQCRRHRWRRLLKCSVGSAALASLERTHDRMQRAHTHTQMRSEFAMCLLLLLLLRICKTRHTHSRPSHRRRRPLRIERHNPSGGDGVRTAGERAPQTRRLIKQYD